MKKKELYNKVIAYFEQAMPVAETELNYGNPFELLIAVILSAQCTDKRVNMITPSLFHDFPTPEALAASSPEVIFEYIRSVSYPNNKAKHLVGMAQMLVKDFHSEVPGTLEELVKLPGVGRKTANVIQSVVFNKATMAVDTHVFRVSHRIGLVPKSCTTPLATEFPFCTYIRTRTENHHHAFFTGNADVFSQVLVAFKIPLARFHFVPVPEYISGHGVQAHALHHLEAMTPVLVWNT